MKLPNGADIRVEVTPFLEEEGAVSFSPEMPDFQPLVDAIEGIATAVNASLQRVKPQKASVELGLESGKLTALLVQGSGKANLKVTLCWEEKG